MKGLMVESLSTIISTFAKLPRQFLLSANFLIEDFNDFIDSTTTFSGQVDDNLPTFQNFVMAGVSAFGVIESVFTEFSNRVGHGIKTFLDNLVSVFTVIPKLIAAEMDGDPLTNAATVLSDNFKSTFMGSFEGFGARLGVIMEEEMADAERLFAFLGTTGVAERAGAKLKKLKGAAGADQEVPGLDAGKKKPGTATDTTFTANQEAARLAIDRLIASYTPGKTATLELAAAQKQLFQAFGLGVLKAGEQKEVMDGLRKAMGEDFMASINPVNANLLKRRDLLAEIEAQHQAGIISEGQMREAMTLALEQSQEQLLQMDKYKESLTDIQSLQMGVTEGLREWGKVAGTQFDIIKNGVVSLGSVITGAMTKALDEGKFSFRQFALDIVNSIRKIIIQLLVQIAVQTILNALSGGGTSAVGALGGIGGGVQAPGGGALAFSGVPKFAKGGAIGANQPAVVGEHGAELFMPSTGGTIVPNNQIGAALGGAAPPPIVNVQVINVDDPSRVIDDMDTEAGGQVIVNQLIRNKHKLKGIIL
jgi:lambda family phage tail tape measure protein